MLDPAIEVAVAEGLAALSMRGLAQFVSAFILTEIEREVIPEERPDAEQGAVHGRWLDEIVRSPS